MTCERQDFLKSSSMASAVCGTWCGPATSRLYLGPHQGSVLSLRQFHSLCKKKKEEEEEEVLKQPPPHLNGDAKAKCSKYSLNLYLDQIQVLNLE